MSLRWHREWPSEGGNYWCESGSHLLRIRAVLSPSHDLWELSLDGVVRDYHPTKRAARLQAERLMAY